MGLFRRHRFKASPLSLAVPLEGSDTVVGLRELQRRADGYNLHKALKLDAFDGSKPPRSWRKRYKGPFLSSLTPNDLRKEPKPWQSFLYGQGVHTYNIPESLDHLCERAEENFVVYLPNYLWITLLLAIFRMMMRPWSILGAVAIAGLVFFRMTAAANPRTRSLPFRDQFWAMLERQHALVQATLHQQGQEATQTRAQQIPESLETLQSVLALICYILVVYCNTIGVLIRASAWAAFIVWTHTSLRRSPSECAEVPKDPAFSRGGQEPRSSYPAVPGIAFTEAMGWSQGGSKDPRRVFREGWQLVEEVGHATGTYCWHGLQFYARKLCDRVKSYVAALFQ